MPERPIYGRSAARRFSSTALPPLPAPRPLHRRWPSTNTTKQMSAGRIDERTLVAEILDRVRVIAAQRQQPEEFIPGRTPVRYAGRVYDAEEMVALVESSLEFW